MSDIKTSKSVPMGVTFGSLSSLGPAAVKDIALLAQGMGYDSLWTVEATGTDAFTLLGAVAGVAPGLGLGTGIIPVQFRPPTLTAMSAASLQALSPDADIWLGLGVSAPGILRQHGFTATDKPIAMMREYVALLKECLTGESVTFEGDFWQVKRFQLAIRQGERRPKVVMAALNPQMLKLAGEIADGVLLNYVPVNHLKASIEKVRSGGDAKIFAYVHACVGDFEQQSHLAQRDIFNYAMADGYANMFRAGGFKDEVDTLREKQATKDRAGALAAVSSDMIQAIDFIGSEREVTEFIRQNIKAGVEHPVLMPMPWGDNRREIAEACMRAAINAY